MSFFLFQSCSNSYLVNTPNKKIEIEYIQGYSLINPLLDCGIEYKELNPFSHQIDNYINKSKKNNKIVSASVYFRHLNNGYWFGVNEKEKYIPASLLKVVTVMNILKYSEYYPGILQDSLRIRHKIGLIERDSLRMPEEVKYNEKYSIGELVEYIIRNSDNESNYALYEYIQKRFDWNVTLNLLNIQIDEDDKFVAAYISPKDYSKLFRVLYNSSFLNQENSEYLLRLMTKSYYNQGISRNITKDVLVAHKYGQQFSDSSGHKQLHDCGIVYYPQNPYLLCVMTKGDNYEELENFISEISDLVYNEIDRQMNIKIKQVIK
jgi:hypothetical protein